MAGRAPSSLSLRSKIREDHLTCTICFMPFNKPKALPCLHTFCESCLRDYASGRGFEAIGKFPCPVCRIDTAIPPSGVKDFPDNYFVASLLDTVEKAKKKSGKVTSSDSSTFASISDSDYSYISSELSFTSEDGLPPGDAGIKQLEQRSQEATAPDVNQSVSSEIGQDFELVPRDCPEYTQTDSREQACAGNERPRLPPPRPSQPPAYHSTVPSPHQPVCPANNQNQVNTNLTSSVDGVRTSTNQNRSNTGSVVDGISNLAIYEPVNYPHVPRGPVNTQNNLLYDVHVAPCSQGLLLKFGQYGNNEIEFKIPYGLAVGKNGEVVVTDRSGSRILVYSNGGHLLSKIKCDCKIADVAMTKDNDILVAVSQAKKAIMRKYNFDGRLLESYGEFYSFESPSGIGVMSNNQVAISNVEGHNLLFFTEQMKFSQKIGWKGSGDNHFMFPNFLCINSKNNIIVSDSGNNCIKVFNCNGVFKRKIASNGSSHGCLSCPMGVSTDPENNIYVADAGNNRVEVFTSKGDYIRSVVQDTDMISPDTKPLNVAVTSKRSVVVLLKGPEFAEIRVYLAST